MDGRTSLTLLVFWGFLLLFVIETSNGNQATAFFAFGDSYVDTGNFVPSNGSITSPWKYPYGVTWPGQAAGRVSSGRLPTDFIAQILGLPTPVPYRLVNDTKHNATAGKGINFAVSASGVFVSFGLPKLSVQVGRFKDSLRSQKYDPDHLKRSVVLVSINGNDYSAKNVIQNSTGRREFVKEVITEMKLQMIELYNLGLRNFLVTNLMPFDCQPDMLMSGSICFNTTMDLVSTHNDFLSEAVSELEKLEGANFLMLDLFKAFSDVWSNISAYGIQEMGISCCSPSSNLTRSLTGCGDYDAQGRALFDLCNNPEIFFFFDWSHPTQKGWETMMNLHYSRFGFVQDGTSAPPKSLAVWLSTLSFKSSPP